MNMNYSHFPILRPKGTALAFALLFSSTAPVLAENVTYPGASLQNASFLFNIVTPSLNSSKDKSNSLENNTVTVNSGGVVPRNVSGAINLRDEDAVRNNYVIVNEGAVVGDGIGFTGIYGGYSLSGDAVNNTVIVNNATINGGTNALIVGGNGLKNTIDNSVSVSNTHAARLSIVGGNAGRNSGASSTIATGNSATVSGSTVGKDVKGGYVWADTGSSGFAIASNNIVTIRNSTVGADGEGDVFGGDTMNLGSGTGTASGNTVTISNSNVTRHVYGGSVKSGVGSGVTTASGNIVTISNSTVGQDVYGGLNSWVVGSPGSGTASGNSVTLNGGSVGVGAPSPFGNVFGGYVQAVFATVINNTATINSGTVRRGVYGGYAESYGSGTAAAFSNSVSINGGTVAENVYGGYAWSNSGIAIAENNVVTITGGTVIGNVYGGYANTTGSGIAEVNQVNIRGNPNLANASIYGGWTSDNANAFESNALNVYSANITVAGLHNFKNLYFHIPDTLPTGGTMLIVEGSITDIGDTFVSLNLTGSRPTLNGGDYFVLIDGNRDTMMGTPENDSYTAGSGTTRVRQGATLLYEFEIVSNSGIFANELWAILPLGAAGPTVDPNTESLSKGFLTGMSLLNQSGDLIAGWGTNAAMGAAIQAERDGAEFGVFAAVSGGKSRYETGSHVDLSGFSLMAGFSGRSQLQPGNLLIGLFFEHGNGTYDVYTSVHGRGDLTYLGMGLIGRMDFTDTDSGHFYAEASARAGNMWNNYNRSGLYDGWGREATYKVSSGYHGLHAGTGYIWKLADKTSLDLYSKVFWTQQEGDSTRLSTGERLDFDNVTSKRLRAGGRLSHAVRPNTNVYVGAAHEHEFGGKASATTSGLAIGVPTLRGRTNIGELGLTLKPSKDRPLLLDVSVQGYTGKREGVAGILHVRYDF